VGLAAILEPKISQIAWALLKAADAGIFSISLFDHHGMTSAALNIASQINAIAFFFSNRYFTNFQTPLAPNCH
jgi:hypothetical protein